MWVSAVLTEGGNVFIENRALLTSTDFEKTLLVNAISLKYFIIFLYQIPVYIITLVLGFGTINYNFIYIIPNSLLLFLFSTNLIGITSYLFARYRDIPKLIGATTTILLMVTPVFWPSNQLSEARRFVVDYNPLYYLVSLIRFPLAGLETPKNIYLVVILLILLSHFGYYLVVKKSSKTLGNML